MAGALEGDMFIGPKAEVLNVYGNVSQCFQNAQIGRNVNNSYN